MSWSVSEAKARLSELLVKARRAPQVIANRGEAVAVVLSKSDYDRLQQLSAAPRPTALAEFLEFTARLKTEGDLGLDLPKRRLEPDRTKLFTGDD